METTLSPQANKINHVFQCRNTFGQLLIDSWRVEYLNEVAKFSGPYAMKRAFEYQTFRDSQDLKGTLDAPREKD